MQLPKASWTRNTLFLLTLCAGSTQLLAAGEDFCKRYARHAIENFQVARGEGCSNLNFPVWSMDFDHHYNWCRKVSEADANKGGEQRVAVLRECRNKQPKQGVITGTVQVLEPALIGNLLQQRTCQDYAGNATNQQQRNLERGCGFTGAEWNANYDDHFNWCMSGENLKYAETEQKKRQDRLVQCNAGKALPELQDNSGILDRTRRIQLDKVFVQAVDRSAAGLEKEIRAIQEQSWNRSRDMVLGRFRDDVKAASYSEKKILSRLPGQAGNIGQAPTIIGEIDRQTGEVRHGSGRPAPTECEGVRYYGKPRITHILSSTKADGYHVTPGDKLVIFGENFYAKPGRVEIELPQGTGNLDIPLQAGNMGDWSRSWTDQLIVVDVPKLAGLYDAYNARLTLMITHPCTGQAFSDKDIKLMPRRVIRQISGEAFLELAQGEKEDKSVDVSLDHKDFVKVSHYPGCGVRIPVVGAMSGSGEEGDDYFFRKKALPPLFSIEKAYLVPKMPGKDWAGLVSRITRDAIDAVSSIASGDILGAAMSLGGLGVESLIKWFDPSVGKYGVWVTEFPPGWPHYRSHWNNTCYTKSPRFGQVIEYVGSFLVMGPDGADPAPGWKNRYGINGVSLAP